MLSNIACCLLGAVNSSLEHEGFEAPYHSYISQQESLPNCSGHLFAFIKHVATDCRNDYGLSGSGISRNDCLNRGVNVFDVTVGQCGPKPLVLRNADDCEGDLYGQCPRCDSDPEDWLLGPEIDECLPLEILEGKILWPAHDIDMSETAFNVFILEQREALRKNIIDYFCKCYSNCYGKQVKVKAEVLRVDDWCEATFIGTKLRVVAYVNE